MLSLCVDVWGVYVRAGLIGASRLMYVYTSTFVYQLLYFVSRLRTNDALVFEPLVRLALYFSRLPWGTQHGVWCTVRY
ncbi:hypothetical protein L211DRAFT_37828 [Terfezia boudieri ATCC MYA-4762]|uniref:Uncharacterized protein n=1 Tax=Terfezia boudieri ATCC MYA-4762 TaxID=1051890 RepID=A0A3N4MQ93_9PEZI|nr:hypothetical protein L211DRAFT_37828 [Terfezia boudieri ATCC MYA-4762]